MATKMDTAKLELIADMLVEHGKPGKVLDGWTLVPAQKAAKNPALAEVYADVVRTFDLSDKGQTKFVLAREKGEQGMIAKLFAESIPDDSASKVFDDAEKKGAKDTTGQAKPAGK